MKNKYNKYVEFENSKFTPLQQDLVYDAIKRQDTMTARRVKNESQQVFINSVNAKAAEVLQNPHYPTLKALHELIFRIYGELD